MKFSSCVTTATCRVYKERPNTRFFTRRVYSCNRGNESIRKTLRLRWVTGTVFVQVMLGRARVSFFKIPAYFMYPSSSVHIYLCIAQRRLKELQGTSAEVIASIGWRAEHLFFASTYICLFVLCVLLVWSSEILRKNMFSTPLRCRAPAVDLGSAVDLKSKSGSGERLLKQSAVYTPSAKTVGQELG